MVRIRHAISLAVFMVALTAFAPNRAHAQYIGGGFGYGGYGGGLSYGGYGGFGGFGGGYGGFGGGFGGGYGGFGGGYGGYGGGYGFGGLPFGYPGIGEALYNPFYLNYGLNPTTLATGITPIAIQSAIADRNLVGAISQGSANAGSKPATLVPGTYRIVIER